MPILGEVHADSTTYVVRAYLLAGLVFHKAVWEVLKRKGPVVQKPTNPRLAVMKMAKIAILCGVILQALAPFDVIPLVEGGSPDLVWKGALLFTAGLAIAVRARIELGRNWSDIESAELQSGHTVISRGLYRWIRHPIYTGDLLLLFGLELELNSWLIAGVVVLAAAVARKAIREEQDLQIHLPDYGDYCRRTKRFIPFVF